MSTVDKPRMISSINLAIFFSRHYVNTNTQHKTKSQQNTYSHWDGMQVLSLHWNSFCRHSVSRVISLHTVSLLESKYTPQSNIDVKNSDAATMAAHGSKIAINWRELIKNWSIKAFSERQSNLYKLFDKAGGCPFAVADIRAPKCCRWTHALEWSNSIAEGNLVHAFPTRWYFSYSLIRSNRIGAHLGTGRAMSIGKHLGDGLSIR